MRTVNTKGKKGTLLLVDDDALLLDSMADWLTEQGYQVLKAMSTAEACELVDLHVPDVVLCDIRLGSDDGFDVLDYCRSHHPGVLVLLMTGYGTVDTGIDALRAGAFDLLTKPLIDEELDIALGRALSQQRVLAENKVLKSQLDRKFGLENIVGQDHRMTRVFDVIDSVADTRATILITGESGTGKSMIARAIHRRSSRRDAPFVEVACGAIPENLLESELFGHVAGAFTGAVGERQGKFEAANGGTIFLDEIGTAPASMQVKLLRVLQDFEFERIGGNKTIKVDTRVILATNEDLSAAVAEGRFRQDLYYRINVINIELPSLRTRVSDIPDLAQYFLDKCVQDTGKNVQGFTDEAIDILRRYRWPGNVRELQNVVERAVLLGKGNVVSVEDLPSHLSGSEGVIFEPTSGQTLKDALSGPERKIILQSLEEHDWNRNETADALGINRTTLYKKMKRLGLDQLEHARFNG